MSIEHSCQAVVSSFECYIIGVSSSRSSPITINSNGILAVSSQLGTKYCPPSFYVIETLSASLIYRRCVHIGLKSTISAQFIVVAKAKCRWALSVFSRHHHRTMIYSLVSTNLCIYARCGRSKRTTNPHYHSYGFVCLCSAPHTIYDSHQQQSGKTMRVASVCVCVCERVLRLCYCVSLSIERRRTRISATHKHGFRTKWNGMEWYRNIFIYCFDCLRLNDANCLHFVVYLIYIVQFIAGNAKRLAATVRLARKNISFPFFSNYFEKLIWAKRFTPTPCEV